MAVRFGGHKRSSNNDKKNHYKLYIEVNGDWSNWYIELYENHPCNSKEELLKREGEVIRLIGTLNVKIAGRDKKEYYSDKADIIKENAKQYHVENKEKRK